MNILDKIVAATQKRIQTKKKNIPLDTLLQQRPPQREAFRFQKALSGSAMSFICEVKKASPSKGLISEDFPYIKIAAEYEKAGADAISVLTEPDFFLGSSDYLRDIRQHVDVPMLCKDFIIDDYQIYEAKAIGADAVLLICSLLDASTLKTFINLAHSLNMSALVETRNENEIYTAIKCSAKIIGANNRDLRTFAVDTATSIELRKYAPPDAIFIAESGIKSRADVLALEKGGINGVLVGEHIMRSNNKKAALYTLKGAAL